MNTQAEYAQHVLQFSQPCEKCGRALSKGTSQWAHVLYVRIDSIIVSRFFARCAECLQALRGELA